MESKNERIKKIFPIIINMADELYPVYMPTDENGYSTLECATLFHRSMECFSFSTARLCYIAVFRKLFLTAFLILVRNKLIDIDISDIKNMKVDTYENMIYLDRLEEEAMLMDILIQRVFDAYGYRYEVSSYKIDDLTVDLYNAESNEEAIEEMESKCMSIMQEKDYIHTNVFNLFCQIYQIDWYGQEDIKIWRFSNKWLSEILNRNYDMAADSERMIMDNISRLNYFLFPDEVSQGIQEYHERTEDYEFAAIESLYVSSDWYGNNEYWCRLDTAFLNFGALLTIPYIDALMDEVDLYG